MAAEAIPLLITGGTGRIGRALRHSWPWFMRGGLRPVWQARDGRPGCLSWDILAKRCPEGVAGGVILGLAGVTQGDGLPLNAPLALATCDAAQAQGARHLLLASSASVYGSGVHDEEAVPRPAGAYGVAKLAMERAAVDWSARTGRRLTLLRIGNIAGFDALLGRAQPGHPVTLDPVSEAGGPLRSYIGPVALGAVLARLCTLAAQGVDLPPVLNVAAPKPLRMASLLDAAGLGWHYGPPRPDVIETAVLETARLQALVRLPPTAASASGMVAEWRSLPA